MSEMKPSFTDMLKLPGHGYVQISPDGQRILYDRSVPDFEENEYRTNIWLVKPDESPLQLTQDEHGSWGGRWAPDGQSIVFLSDRDGDKGSQLYLLKPTGEPRRLTEMKRSVWSPRWSPDGRQIAFLCREEKSQAQKDREKEYGNIHVENEDYRHAHLWVYDTAEDKVEQLTQGKNWTVNRFHWSPDSKHIALVTQPTPDMDHLDNCQVCLLEMDSLKVSVLTPPGHRLGMWSPAGDTILVTHAPAPSMYMNSKLYLVDLETKEQRLIPVQSDEAIWPVAYRENGIFAVVPQRTGFEIWLIDPINGGHQRISPDDPAGFVADSVSVSQDGQKVACLASNAERLQEIVLIDTRAGTTTLLTEFTKAVEEWSLVPPENYIWQSVDGTEIEGVLYKPRDFDPAQHYPLLVIIHGGPSWLSARELVAPTFETCYPAVQWLDRGALILMPNYRGSIGYGQAFKTLNVKNLGLGDYEDVISGVDALIAEGFVDPERVGAMGWSQGGYISAFITTYSDRFKAVSVGAGISNWATYYVNTDIHAFTREYLEATPWEDPEIYARTSPMTYIKQARTPTLIQHGEFDQRVPTPNAYELYQGLRDVGVTARLVIYRGMGHGVTKPRLQRHRLQDNWDWFERHLWGESETEDAATAPSQLYVALPADAPAVRRWAERDGAAFRVLTWEGFAAEVEAAGDAVRDDKQALPAATEVAALIPLLVEEAAAGGWQKLNFYSEAAEKEPVILAEGILQTVTALCDGLSYSDDLDG